MLLCSSVLRHFVAFSKRPAWAGAGCFFVAAEGFLQLTQTSSERPNQRDEKIGNHSSKGERRSLQKVVNCRPTTSRSMHANLSNPNEREERVIEKCNRKLQDLTDFFLKELEAIGLRGEGKTADGWPKCEIFVNPTAWRRNFWAHPQARLVGLKPGHGQGSATPFACQSYSRMSLGDGKDACSPNRCLARKLSRSEAQKEAASLGPGSNEIGRLGLFESYLFSGWVPTHRPPNTVKNQKSYIVRPDPCNFEVWVIGRADCHMCGFAIP